MGARPLGLLTVVSLFGFAVVISRVARVPAAVALLQAMASIILLLYAGALAGVLWWMALAVNVGGAAVLGYEALRAVRGGVRITIPVPYGLLALLVGVFWLIHGQSEYRMYDEYSHWGIFLKEMLALDAFGPADTSAMHPRYPPAPTLWQYLFSALQTPTEGKAYLAEFVLLIVPLLVLWNEIAWRHVGWIAAILAACVHVIANYGLGVSSLYVDHAPAAWFVGVLIAFVAQPEPVGKRLLVFAAPIAVMALLKDSGLAFALSSVAIIAGLVARREWRESGALGRGARSGVAAVLLLSVPALLSVNIWSLNRDRIGAPRDVYSIAGIASGVIGGAATQDDRKVAEITRRFATTFATQQLASDEVTWRFNEFSYGIRGLFTAPLRLTTLGLLLLFGTWFGVLIVLRSRRRTTVDMGYRRDRCAQHGRGLSHTTVS